MASKVWAPQLDLPFLVGIRESRRRDSRHTVENVGISKKSVRVQKISFRQKIGKPQQTLKNTKNIYCFQNFEHIKQQQHHINTLAHKYGEIIDIYVVDAQ
jgi:hypothetical protein